MLPNLKCIVVAILLSFYDKNVLSNPIAIAMEGEEIIMSIIDFLKPEDETPQKILNAVTEISTRLNEIGMNLDKKIDDLASGIPQSIHDIIRIENDVKDMERNIIYINYMYKTIFINWKNNSLSNDTLESFINTATGVGHDNPIYRVEYIYSLFFLGELNVIKTSWLSIYLKDKKVCDELYATHLWLDELFSLIAKVEMRAFVMVTAAYKLRTTSTHGNYDGDINRTKNRFLERMNNYLILMKESLKNSSTEIYRCDAKSPTKGESYIEFEKFSQTFIVNTDQLQSEEGCKYCNEVTDFHGPIINDKDGQTYPIKGTCNGRIVGCKFWSDRKIWIPWGQNIQVCVLPPTSSRRYQWFKDSDNNYYGLNSSTCPGNIISDDPYHKRRSSPPYPSVTLDMSVSTDLRDYNCYYCMCTCIEDDDSSTSVRKFNPHLQFSDIQNNMVVIGVRLVQDKDGVISIQIKEGKLISEGKILPGSGRWVPVQKPKDPEKLIELNHNTKHINLEDLHVPSTDSNLTLITCVGFVKYSRFDLQQNYGKDAIGIQLIATGFNFTSAEAIGNIIPVYSRYRNAIYGPPTPDLKLGKAKNPLGSYSNLPDNSKDAQWVEIQPSDFNSDAGQTVVPFLDTQPLYTDPEFPLTGIGLMHRGTPDYGGYISLKIMTLNLTQFIKLFTERVRNQLNKVEEYAIGIKLSVRSFNFTTAKITGPLKLAYSQYKDTISGPPSDDLNLGMARDPLKSRSNQPDNLVDTQWVKIRTSNVESGAEQTVVPFLDIQPVYTYPAFPLTEIGLMHRGTSNFGGYIALKIFTSNSTIPNKLEEFAGF